MRWSLLALSLLASTIWIMTPGPAQAETVPATLKGKQSIPRIVPNNFNWCGINGAQVCTPDSGSLTLEEAKAAAEAKARDAQPLEGAKNA